MIFSFGGGGGKEDVDTKSKGEQSEEERRAGLESQTKTGITGERAGESAFGFDEEITRLFDAETLELLRSLTQTSGGAFAEGVGAASSLNQFANFLRERAAGTQAFVDERTGAIVDAAQARGEARVARRGTNLAESAGSTFNTLVQRGIARDEIALDTELAALESNLALQGRQLETDALAQAGQLSAAVPAVLQQGLSSIVPLLRGGEVVQQQRRVAGGERERTQFTLDDILAAISGDRFGTSRFEREGKEDTEFGEFEFGFDLGG